MKYFVFAAFVFIVASCGPKYDKEITLDDIRENINYLASDSLKGRKSGEQGDLLAAQYIVEKFEAAGLELLFDDGFQEFELVTSAEIADGNQLQVNDNSYEVEEDFLPYAFSANTTVEAEVVFAGFGLEVDRDSLQWNDFEGIDVSGKWILVLQGDPDLDNPNSPYLEFSSERAKALKASDKNAAGIIFVAGTKFSEEDELSSLFFDKNNSRFSIPVIQVTREVANEILKSKGQTIKKLETEMLEQNAGLNLELSSTVKTTVNVELKETTTRNVAALLPGTDETLKDEYVVLGAHYDHLGMGGPGSGSRAIDTVAIHNGADDNASGVSTVIQLAEKLAGDKSNKRSVIFVAFGAEEMGLLGSKSFTANPPVKTDKMVGMFNFDMIGRLDEESQSLSIGGSKTSKETEQLLNDLNPGFQLALSGEGIGPSDHASFYLQDIPVFFISTGAHPDYHTPQDDAELINFEGAQKVMDYSAALVDDVVTRAKKLTFQEAGSKFQRSRGGRFKVTLGVMPDFAGVEKRGMRVDAVSKGKPAHAAGMKNGDIIIAINGKKVGNIYEYMDRLQKLEAGETISVDVLRDGKPTVLIVQL
ncbi:M28 family peptidase [Draconibacterium halophilum]|uniref:M28 family peptidase n=1 Tax=Draconibacterium halophilum TaxID=2706887 RepID=A0A6C0RET3_9BACT|nr:M28 family peptidase [Draconibacterium halophilum]QIA08456.1 M28 family peptidase [Draconibacterium halophilum]